MNNLAYMSQDPAKVASQVEELVRADLGATAPLAFRIEPGDGARASLGTVAADTLKALFGGRPATLFNLVFDLSAPRPARLELQLDRQGVGCRGGLITMSAPISKRVTSPVSLGEHSFFGGAKFAGDDGAAVAKLNGDKDLLKKSDKLSRTTTDIGGAVVEAPRFFKLFPAATGAEVVLVTLPRSTKMGMSATTDAKDFLDLVARMEALL